MKLTTIPFLLLLIIGFASCNSDDSIPQIQSISKTVDGSSSYHNETFTFTNGALNRYTYEEAIANTDISYTYISSITSNESSLSVYCHKNYERAYSITYSRNENGLVDNATYIDAASISRNYTFSYTTINGEYYLKEIAEYYDVGEESEKEFYRFTLDYTDFSTNQISLSQCLFGVEKINAVCTVDRNNLTGICDNQLVDYHPFNKHLEMIYGGYMGHFDYFITSLTQDNKTTTSVISYKEEGYPEYIIRQPENAKAITLTYHYL